jgi:hypothetical protein
MMRKFAFAILAAALAVPAMAAPATSTEAPKPEKPKKEKKICKHVATTESRMGDTVCKTAAEWDELPADDAERAGYRR